MTDVRQYGAIGDGASDDTAAFAAALAAESVVDVPPGVFKLTSVTVPGGRTIRGVGGPSKLLMQPTGDLSQRMLRIVGTSDVRVESVEIDGNGAQMPSTEQAKCIYIQDASDVRVYDVAIHDAMGDGLSVYGTSASQTTGGVLLDRFRYWNQARAAIVVHGVAPAEVTIRDATVERGMLVPGSPVSPTALINLEPSNPGVSRAFTLERVTVLDGGVTIGASPHHSVDSKLIGCTVRDVKIRAVASNVGLSLTRVYGALIDNLEVSGAASSALTIRDAGQGVPGEMGRVLVTGARLHGQWSSHAVAVWTNGLRPPGVVVLSDVEVSGHTVRGFSIDNSLSDVSLIGCRSEGGQQGVALTGVRRALLIDCHSAGHSYRGFWLRGGAPYEPLTGGAYACTATAPALESVGDVAGDWFDIQQV